MRRIKTFICCIISICMVLGMMGCGKKEDAKVDKKENDTVASGNEKITLGISAYPSWYVWFICEKEGIFEKYGLDVELVWFANYSDSVQAFEGNQLDYVSLALADVLSPYAQGKQDKIVLINDYSNGADGLVATEGIESIKDLKGKTVATEYGTIEHFLLVELLKRNDMTEEDIQFANMTISDSGTAFLTGAVDAASLWEPALSQAMEKENSSLLYSSEEDPGLIPSVLVANDQYLEGEDEDVEKLINAWFDALEFYCENPEQSIKDMAEGAEITEEEMKVTMSGSYLYTLQENIDAMTKKAGDYSYIPYTSEILSEFLMDYEFIEEKPDSFEELFDVSYLENVAKERESKAAPDTSYSKE